jgi:hypothetical protein
MNYHHCFSFVKCIAAAKDTAARLITTTNANLIRTTVWPGKYTNRILRDALTLPSAYLKTAYFVLGILCKLDSKQASKRKTNNINRAT